MRAMIAYCTLENKALLRRMASFREQATDALPVMDTTNRLTEERCDRDHLDLVRQHHRLGFNRIRHQETLDRTGVEPLHRALAEDAVGYRRVHRLGTALDEFLRGIGKGAGGDREVVNDQGGLALHLTDDLQHLSPFIVC